MSVLLSTENYLNKVAPKQDFAKGAPPQLWKKLQLVHDHPTLIKAANFALKSLSLAAVALPALFQASLKLTIGLGAAGITLFVISHIAYRTLRSYGLLPEGKVFTPGIYMGATLSYQGNVPILTIESDDPYKAGKSQGYLMGKPITKLLERVHSQAQLPYASEIPKVIENLKSKIPQEYLTEMQGLAEGLNAWIDENAPNQRKISVGDVIIFHMMPDQLYLNLSYLRNQQLFCTAIVTKDDNKGMILARNMDWMSYGILGSHSLVVNRKFKDRSNTVGVGIPGFIGSLTGMNSSGLSMCMNVCGKGHMNEKGGIPAGLFNRKLLESCQTVDDAENFIKTHDPLGSYHLNVADKTKAKSFHLYQGSQQTVSWWRWIFTLIFCWRSIKHEQHYIRELGDKSPLITTNSTFDGKTGREVAHMHSSSERAKAITALFQHAHQHIDPSKKDMEKVVRYGLGLPFVNNPITLHSVLMIPQEKRMRVAYDNSFAASNRLQEIDMTPLLT